MVVVIVVVGAEVGAAQSKSLQGQPAEQFSLIKFMDFFTGFHGSYKDFGKVKDSNSSVL